MLNLLVHHVTTRLKRLNMILTLLCCDRGPQIFRYIFDSHLVPSCQSTWPLRLIQSRKNPDGVTNHEYKQGRNKHGCSSFKSQLRNGPTVYVICSAIERGGTRAREIQDEKVGGAGDCFVFLICCNGSIHRAVLGRLQT
jgi:hypothetical protein